MMPEITNWKIYRFSALGPGRMAILVSVNSKTETAEVSANIHTMFFISSLSWVIIPIKSFKDW